MEVSYEASPSSKSSFGISICFFKGFYCLYGSVLRNRLRCVKPYSINLCVIMLLALCENYEKLIDDVLFLFNHARATWFWLKSIPHDSLNLVIWDFGVVKRIPWLTQIYASWLTQSLKECKSASQKWLIKLKPRSWLCSGVGKEGSWK